MVNTPNSPSPELVGSRATRQDVVRRGTLAMVVLVVTNVLLAAFGSAIVPERIGFAVFGPEAALVVSFLVALLATFSYTLVSGATASPDRAFGLLWAGLLGLSLIPLAFVVPQFGVPTTGIGLLATMHVTSTAVVITTMTGLLE